MSGKTFSVRLNAELLDRVRELAKKDHRNVNSEITYLIEKGIQKYEHEKALLKKLEDEEIVRTQRTDEG